MSDVPTFWIYVTLHPEPRARVHVDLCRYVQGRATSTSPNNWWAHAFGTLADAHTAARRMLSTREPLVENCVNCIGLTT